MSVRAQPLILVRHAHAEWPAYVGRDFDRPLTSQGIRDANATAAAIRDAALKPQLLLTSPALRTLQTARIIATTLALPASAIQEVDALYNAAPDILEEALSQAYHAKVPVLLVAHNPGISELARKLTGDTAFAAFRPGQWLHIPRSQT